MGRPKLGQHFLHDANIIQRIIRIAELKPHETVLEIGAGRGILTKALAQKVRQVLSIELDQKLESELRTTLDPFPNVRLFFEDALRFPLETLPDPFKVVANLPYYLSTPLLFRLLDFRTKITALVLMLQREVANRIVASPGGKDYGSLSVALQYYTEPKVAFRVSRSCFSPPPKVDSVVLQITIRQSPPFEVRNEAFFLSVVKKSFSHRRKVIKNSLRDSGFSSDILESGALTVGLDLNRRAETLSMHEFGAFSDILFELTS